MANFKKLKRKLGRINKYVNSSFETLSISGLFTTKEGKKLGKKLRDLNTFVFAMTFLTFPAGKLKNEWVSLIRRGDIDKLKPYSEPDVEDGFEKFSQLAAVFVDLMDDEDEDDFSVLFGKRGLRRLLALQTLSAFSYVDAYGKKLIEYLITVQSVETRILRYLSENEIRSNKDESPVETIKQLKNLGLGQRFDILEKSLNVKEICVGLFDDFEYDRYRRLFSYFIRLRGKIAHGNPEPSLSKFDHAFFQKAKKDVKEAFSVFSELSEIPEILVPHMEIIESWFKKTSSTMAIIYAVPKMVIVILSLLDSVVEFLIQKESSFIEPP